MVCFGSQFGVLMRTRMHSNMTPTDRASSAAPGEGSVLSTWALTSTECSFPSGVPSEITTMMFVSSTYVLYSRLPMISNLAVVLARGKTSHNWGTHRWLPLPCCLNTSHCSLRVGWALTISSHCVLSSVARATIHASPRACSWVPTVRYPISSDSSFAYWRILVSES